MKKKQIITIVVLVLLCACILIVPLMTIHDSEFGGADGAAEEVIAQIDPDYEPWAESVVELPGGFGYLVARKKYRTGEAT